MSHQAVVDEEAVPVADLTHLTEEKDTDGETQTPDVGSSDQETSVATMDWDSPEDAGNPRNWPTWKRVYHTSIPALYGFVM